MPYAEEDVVLCPPGGLLHRTAPTAIWTRRSTAEQAGKQAREPGSLHTLLAMPSGAGYRLLKGAPSSLVHALMCILFLSRDVVYC